MTYPDAWFLSGCVVPIQMRGSYPDAWFLSGCMVPIRMRGSYPDAWFLPECAVPIRMLARCYPQGGYPLPVVSTGHRLALSSLLMMVRDFIYDAGFHHHHPSSRLTP